MLTGQIILRTVALVSLCGWATPSSLQVAQSPTPEPEHKKLEMFVGEWNFEGDSKAIPALGMTDAGHVSYRHVSQMANGGFFLETRRTGMGTRGPVTELFVYSYNAVTKTYRQDGYNNRGQVRTFTGTLDGLTWSFVGTNTNADGSVTKERFTLTYSPDRSSATVRSEHSKDGVNWYERLNGKYTKPPAVSGAATRLQWGVDVLRQKPEWYASAEARAVADSVLTYQSSAGGWPKNTDLATPPPSVESLAEPNAALSANTIDNNGTTLPLHFLALMVHATGEASYRAAFDRGLDYLLAAQYPNGGWPQYFPLREGYYSRITYNDNAMVNVLVVLRDAATGKTPYAFVDSARRARAGAAVAKGIDIILRTQVRQRGTRTAWCAQHDEKTLEPAGARNYEPPTLSGNESVGIVRFLMDIERPTPEIVAAIEGAVTWLKASALTGLRFEEFIDADGRRDRRVVADPVAGPLWARFYELGTNRPVFTGRDKVIRYSFSEIEHERRSGYAYYGTWAATLLAQEYARWRTNLDGRGPLHPAKLRSARSSLLAPLRSRCCRLTSSEQPVARRDHQVELSAGIASLRRRRRRA